MTGTGGRVVPEPLAYARARSVSSSTSTNPGRGESSATKRWTREETRSRAATAPPFRFPPPADDLLDELCRQYTAITGDAVRSPAKRNLVAACGRLHGRAFGPLVERLFSELGTVTNLLGELRLLEPEGEADLAHSPPPSPSPPTTDGPAEAPDPTVIYKATGRPPFDPTSKRRYDRHSSNPDAVSFFSDEELAAATNSPSVKALTR